MESRADSRRDIAGRPSASGVQANAINVEDLKVVQGAPLLPPVSTGPSGNASFSNVVESDADAHHARVAASEVHEKAKTFLVIHKRQERNPVVKMIRQVAKVVESGFPADYLVGPYSAVLFLSLKWHLLYPKYIYERERQLGRYKYRALLVLVDTPNPVEPLTELTKLSILRNMTLLCASSEREAAIYLETMRACDQQNPSSILQNTEGDFLTCFSTALTAVRPINKSNVLTLGKRFGTLSKIVGASEAQLRNLPGLGAVKARKLFDAFNEPLVKKRKRSEKES